MVTNVSMRTKRAAIYHHPVRTRNSFYIPAALSSKQRRG